MKEVNINTRLIWTKSREELICRDQVNCDIHAQLPVFADEICLSLEIFISRPPSNPREHGIVITRDMVFCFPHELWEHRRQWGIS